MRKEAGHQWATRLARLVSSDWAPLIWGCEAESLLEGVDTSFEVGSVVEPLERGRAWMVDMDELDGCADSGGGVRAPSCPGNKDEGVVEASQGWAIISPAVARRFWSTSSMGRRKSVISRAMAGSIPYLSRNTSSRPTRVLHFSR